MGTSFAHVMCRALACAAQEQLFSQCGTLAAQMFAPAAPSTTATITDSHAWYLAVCHRYSGGDVARQLISYFRGGVALTVLPTLMDFRRHHGVVSTIINVRRGRA